MHGKMIVQLKQKRKSESKRGRESKGVGRARGIG